MCFSKSSSSTKRKSSFEPSTKVKRSDHRSYTKRLIPSARYRPGKAGDSREIDEGFNRAVDASVARENERARHDPWQQSTQEEPSPKLTRY